MLHHSSRDVIPHMASQQGLLRTLLASVALAQGISKDVGPYVPPNLPPHLLAADHLSPPQTGKHGNIVL